MDCLVLPMIAGTTLCKRNIPRQSLMSTQTLYAFTIYKKPATNLQLRSLERILQQSYSANSLFDTLSHGSSRSTFDDCISQIVMPPKRSPNDLIRIVEYTISSIVSIGPSIEDATQDPATVLAWLEDERETLSEENLILYSKPKFKHLGIYQQRIVESPLTRAKLKALEFTKYRPGCSGKGIQCEESRAPSN